MGHVLLEGTLCESDGWESEAREGDRLNTHSSTIKAPSRCVFRAHLVGFRISRGGEVWGMCFCLMAHCVSRTVGRARRGKASLYLRCSSNSFADKQATLQLGQAHMLEKLRRLCDMSGVRACTPFAASQRSSQSAVTNESILRGGGGGNQAGGLEHTYFVCMSVCRTYIFSTYRICMFNIVCLSNIVSVEHSLSQHSLSVEHTYVCRTYIFSNIQTYIFCLYVCLSGLEFGFGFRIRVSKSKNSGSKPESGRGESELLPTRPCSKSCESDGRTRTRSQAQYEHRRAAGTGARPAHEVEQPLAARSRRHRGAPACSRSC